MGNPIGTSGAVYPRTIVYEACRLAIEAIDAQRAKDRAQFVETFMPERRWFWGLFVSKPAMTADEALAYIEQDSTTRVLLGLTTARSENARRALVALGNLAGRKSVDLQVWVSAADMAWIPEAIWDEARAHPPVEAGSL